MIKVRTFSNFGDSKSHTWMLRRQTPLLSEEGVYKKIKFVHDDSYDYAVVFNWPSASDPIKVKPEKVIGFLMEPPELEELELKRLAPIGRYFTPVAEHQKLLGNRFRHHVMVMFLHTLICENQLYLPSNKLKKISMIVSGKVRTPFQQKRFDLLNKLLATNLAIDFYGRDLQMGSDKRIKGPLAWVNKEVGLLDYSMSLAFENTSCPEGISEKLYDCVISNTIPVTNAPGAMKHLPENSYISLDFNKPVDALVADVAKLCELNKEQLAKYDAGVLKMKAEVIEGRFSLVDTIFREITALAAGT